MKNIDGIQKIKSGRVRVKVLKIHTAGNTLATGQPVRKKREPFFVVAKNLAKQQGNATVFFRNFYRQKRVPVAVAVLGLILAFGSGIWAALDTQSTIAEDQPQVLGVNASQPNQSPAPSGIPITGPQLQSQDGAVANDVLFNTPIELLKNYLQDVSEPDIINRRKIQIAQFLKDHNSPLVGSAETIAEQDHWQFILAIAFAESTLGKNCVDNNCSNIGSRPGAASWRSYSNYNRWVVDFNRLLDKKYKDSTLEQMCGVYVQPCNPNWLAATRQILNELQQEGIN